MKPRFAWGVAIAAALTVAVIAPAMAQPDFKAAAEHYKAAEEAMAKGDFAAAALEYGVAYDITKDPILFFKIGTANEKAGKCGIALTYYARYLKEGNPSDEYRRLTDERIVACKATLGEGGTGGAKPDGGTEPDGGAKPDGGAGAGGSGGGATGGVAVPDDGDEPTAGGDLGGGLGPSFTEGSGSWKRSAAWISTGATIGLLAVASVLYMSAEGSEEDIQALIDFRDQNNRPVRYAEVQRQYEELVDEGKRFDRLSTIAFAAAGVGAAAAITFFILDSQDGGGERAPGFLGTRVVPQLDRHGAGVVVGWGF